MTSVSLRRRQGVAARHQLSAQLAMVVDLAVEHELDRAVLVAHRLLAHRRIHHAQSPHAERDVRRDVATLLVGTAMHDRRAHRAQRQLPLALGARAPCEADDPAHRRATSSPVIGGPACISCIDCARRAVAPAATSRFIISTKLHIVTTCSTRNDTWAIEPKRAAMRNPSGTDLHGVHRLRRRWTRLLQLSSCAVDRDEHREVGEGPDDESDEPRLGGHVQIGAVAVAPPPCGGMELRLAVPCADARPDTRRARPRSPDFRG